MKEERVTVDNVAAPLQGRKRKESPTIHDMHDWVSSKSLGELFRRVEQKLAAERERLKRRQRVQACAEIKLVNLEGDSVLTRVPCETTNAELRAAVQLDNWSVDQLDIS